MIENPSQKRNVPGRLHRALFVVLCTALIISVTERSAAQLTQRDLEAWLDGFVPYALQEADIAGAVIVVVKNGHVFLRKGYGYADMAQRLPMDPDRTIVGVGSVSKLFVWTAVMQLVERGKLDLDRDVNAYLDFRIPPTFEKPITAELERMCGKLRIPGDFDIAQISWRP
jgi:CubicO group peptidase (beta-lactamase class C family)